MSFTSRVKDEVSKLDINDTEKISELSGIVSTFDNNNSIIINTENNSVARRIYTLFKDVFGIHPKITLRRGYNYNKKLIYILEVKNKSILKDLGIGEKIETFITADDELRRAYLRGVFMICASINDPKTSRYHLEFNLYSESLALFINDLLNAYDLNSKVLHRNSKYMVYFRRLY